jgi:hypothetical protein
MGTAAECPSKQLGLCSVINNNIKCYAYRDEQLHCNVVPQARKTQEKYWKQTELTSILKDMLSKIERRRNETRYIRFNESGDFWNQNDITKLSKMAEYFKTKNIITYGYTARSDLDFEGVHFLVKGSGFIKPGMTGMTTVINHGEKTPEGFIKCPGGIQSCATCNLCKINVLHNIAFEKHT